MITGTTSNNMHWKLEGDVLTVSGNGVFFDDIDGGGELPWNAPWNDMGYYIYHVVIEKGCTGIGYYAFCGLVSLEDIQIPDTVSFIGYKAFWECQSLSQVHLPENVRFLHPFSFGKCESLTSITLPESVEEVGMLAFDRCIGLTSLTILNPGIQIEEDSFSGCSNLTELNVPPGIQIDTTNIYD